ncbi:MAG: ABC transporter permease [Tannerellaceae bacterium]|jgi:putative ABC transport system permease protein|nr:ABC transporter permease [Tannerellaceae bacterium]
MIRHIFTLIWNGRKANGWILLEYTLVFCVLWFCVDYLCFIVKSYCEPLGFDIEHVYQLEMGTRNVAQSELNSRDNMEDILLFIDRVSRYPGVTSVCMARQGLPYMNASSWTNFTLLPDSLNEQIRVRWVTSGFFDVFKLDIKSGRIFQWEDEAEADEIIIGPDRYNRFGKYPGATIDISQISKIADEMEEHPVVGTVGKVKVAFFKPYESCVYAPMGRDKVSLRRVQIAIRITPETDKDFAKHFMKEMKSQLEIGPYYLTTVTSFQDIKAQYMENLGISDQLKSIYAVTAFLVVNIFLGIIGTFWYRTQARRSEIGLRIAMGATRQNVRQMMFLETLFLLFIASIIAVNICINIGQNEVLGAFDIPVGDRTVTGSGIEQDFLNYFLTFLFLGMVSLLAVWYPTYQASIIPPAEALREE